jgi:hypothetical protein
MESITFNNLIYSVGLRISDFLSHLQRFMNIACLGISWLNRNASGNKPAMKLLLLAFVILMGIKHCYAQKSPWTFGLKAGIGSSGRNKYFILNLRSARPTRQGLIMVLAFGEVIVF